MLTSSYLYLINKAFSIITIVVYVSTSLYTRVVTPPPNYYFDLISKKMFFFLIIKRNLSISLKQITAPYSEDWGGLPTKKTIQKESSLKPSSAILGIWSVDWHRMLWINAVHQEKLDSLLDILVWIFYRNSPKN